MKCLGYYDYHIHSTVSFDALSGLYDACRVAAQKGMAGLTFTEHWEEDYEGRQELVDIPSYQKQIEQARAAFPTLEIGMGLEFGLLRAPMAKKSQGLQLVEWDFVLGACHNIDGINVSKGHYCHGKERQAAYHGYIQELYSFVQSSPHFDVLAHLDLVRRCPNYENRSLAYPEFADELDALLRLVIERGSGIEINTTARRYGLGGPQPDISILKRYRELGGEIVTVGSDSHSLQTVGYDMESGYALLRAAGFRYVSLFRKRKCIQATL